MKKENLKEIISRDAHCFGCSQKNPHGLKMRFYVDDATIYSWPKVPDYLCGWDGIVHGGVLSTILDEIMSWSAIYNIHRVVMTKTMTVDFFKPVYIADDLRVEGRVIEQTNEREVIVEGKIYKGDHLLCAQSRGTFAVFTAKAVKRMKIMPPEVLEGFGDLLDLE
ncbi:PaaI family thioesterase [uncultured Desulfuromusa sp.]|uniref:PaaI family thioesterase n=1 Tax=uncultured Desulfuromusa sp. TaxID=219183 RepID=UPI002AA6B2D1|nr:PaaI family thioesterase [uncultured Desulfuromusa sp.]